MAIAHDYLTQRGGAERVVLALCDAFPDAPIYTTLYDPETTYPAFRGRDVRTSWLNRSRRLREHHRAALPLLPFAASSIDIDHDADVVVASSSGWAHGFTTSAPKLTYCYSPARWLYEPQRYLGSRRAPVARAGLRLAGPALRRWDQRAAASVDRFLAISTVTQKRLARTYGVTADVVAAPHHVDPEMVRGHRPTVVPGLPEPGYCLVVSRLLPYKNVDAVVAAFAQRPDDRLVVVGTGPQKSSLLADAAANVTFLEDLADDEMLEAYARCRLLVAAANEDFGLTPLEAAAFGKPCAALRWGGFLDTVREGETGVFFDAAEQAAILDALDRADERTWDADLLQAYATEFSTERFAQAIRSAVAELMPSEPAPRAQER